MPVFPFTVGTEIRVNATTAADQKAPCVTGLSDGGWVITWQSLNQDGSGYGIYQQRYDKTGAPSSTVDTLVNTTTANDQADPSVTALPDGGWLVTWTSQNQDVGWNGGIYQQRFNKNGVAQFPADKLVNTNINLDQSQPSVTALKDGGWVITWVTEGQDGSGTGVYQQRYNGTGDKVGGETRVNVLTEGSQTKPAITALPDGGWLVTWESHSSTGNAIFQQRYSATGVATSTTDIPVETTGGDYKIISSVTTLADGGWVVTWTTYSSGGDVVQQRFDKDGIALFATPRRVNVHTSDLQEPAAVTALKNGGWVVVWQSANQDGSGTGIYMQAFDKDGNPTGPADTLVNTTTAGNQEMPSVTALADGWIVTWQSAAQDGSGYGIYQKRYITSATPTDVTLSRTSVNEDVTGVIAILEGVDPNVGDTFTFTLTEDPSGKFVIFGNELRLKPDAKLDYETDTSHVIKITVTDQTGLSVTKTVTITVNDVAENRAPMGVFLSRHNVDEDETGLIATLEGVDADAGDTFTYTLAEDASGKFEIFGNELRLKADASLDYETARSHTLKITVTDRAGDSVTKTIVITVNDIDDTNDTPINIRLNGGLGAAVSEDADADSFIGVLSATDGDGDPITYSFEPGGDAGGLFIIDPVKNQIRLAPGAVLDYEALPAGARYYTLSIIADDGKGGVSAPQTITIGITDVNEKPDAVITGTGEAGTLIVDEGAANDTLVATLSGLDPEGDAITYTLLDNAGERFKVVGSEIRVANGALLDFEAAGGEAHELTILVVDAKGATQVKKIVVAVQGRNDAPTHITLSGVSVNENADNETVIGDLGAVDQDAGDAFTYTLLDDAGGRFKLDATKTKIVVADGGKLDFESASSHTIRVLVTDKGGLTFEKTIVINVNDQYEAPANRAPTDITFTGGAKGNASVDENAGDETVVGSLDAVDPDSGDSFTYELLDDAGGRFKLDATGTKIVVADGSLIDYEAAASYNIKIQVSDGKGGTFVKTIAVAANNINEAPTGIVLTGTSVDERAASNVFVGSINVIDEDLSGTYTHELIDNAGGRFKLAEDGRSILVANGALLDYATAASHDIVVRVTDGGHVFERTITIHLNDLPEPPVNHAPTDISLSLDTVAENATNGTVIGLLGAVDEDDGDILTYALVDDAEGRFEIFDGKIRVKDSTRLDYEDATSHTIRVRVTDKGGKTFEKDFVISLTDVDEPDTSIPVNRAPTDITLTGGAKGNASVDENAGDEIVVGDLVTIDPDTGDAFTYTLIDDAGGRFKLDSTNTKILVADGSLIDYESATSYTIRVQVSDGKGGTLTQSLVIAVNNVNEAPTDIILSGGAVDEGAANNIFVGSFGVIDQDARGAYVYELVDDAGGRFKLSADGKSILVANGALLDYETATSHAITVRVHDGDKTIERVVTIHLNNLPEPPVNTAPTDITLSVDHVLENTTNGTVIGLLNGQDDDADETFTYTLVDDAEGRFEIFDGKIRVKDSTRLDYEDAATHTIRVRVTDKGGLSFEKDFTIHVDDVDEPARLPVNHAPLDITLTGGAKGNASVDENPDEGVVVGDLGALDSDTGDSFTYELLDDAGGRFKLDETKTKIVVADGSLIDFETATSYAVRVQVSDGRGGTFTKIITIAVNNVNEEPLDILLTSEHVDEGAANNVFVGTLSVLDRDAAGAYTYELVDNAGGRFKLAADGKSILVADGTLLDYETATSHDITVRVHDGDKTIERVITIRLNNLPEPPVNLAPTDITLSTLTIAENAKNGTLIGLLGAQDGNLSDTFTYELLDDAEGRFDVFNGRLRVRDGSRLDYEEDTSHTIRMRVTDKGGLSFEKDFTITLSDVDETPPNNAPRAIVKTGREVTHATDNGGNVNPFSGVTFEDDESDTLDVKISFNGADGDLVIPAALASKVTLVPSNDGRKVYTVSGKPGALADIMNALQFNPTDRSGAAAGTAFVTTFTIEVNDLAHATAPAISTEVHVRSTVANRVPTDIGLSNTVVQELTSSTDVKVGNLSATDGNVGEALTYQIMRFDGSWSASDGRFTIVGNELRANGFMLDFEQAASHAIQIKVTDSQGASFVKSFTISVTDLAVENTAGSASDDVFVGGAGNDILGGGAGNDRINGGLGSDVLTGGTGFDVFVFKDALNKRTNVDQITDFSVPDDSIWLDNAIFKKLGAGSPEAPKALSKAFFTVGAKAKDKNDYIIYDKKSGILSYDADGSGKGAAVAFAKLSKNLKFTHKDFFVV
jgi:hypothetical protein